MLQFNPSLKPKAPDFSSVAALLNQASVAGQGVNKGIDSLVSAFDDYGKQRRSGEITDLIGSGKLEGLSEQEQRALIAKTAGGSTTAQNQQLVQNFLGSTRATNEAEAKVQADALAQQNLLDVLSKKQGFSAAESEKGRQFSSGETQKERELKSKLAFESNSLTELLGKMRDVTARRGQDVSSGDAAAGRQVQYAGQEVQKRGQDIAAKTAADSLKAKLDIAKYSKPKETTLSKIGVKSLTQSSEPVKEITDELEEFISDKSDVWWDRELDDAARTAVTQSVQDFVRTPKGQEVYATGGIEGVYNQVKKDLDKAGLTLDDSFNWKNVLYYSPLFHRDTPFQKKLVKK